MLLVALDVALLVALDVVLLVVVEVVVFDVVLLVVLDDAGVLDALDVSLFPHANKPKPNNAIKLSFKICFFIFSPLSITC